MKKKNIYHYFIMFAILLLSGIYAADGQPPPPPEGHGHNGNHSPGGNAPIDGGSLLLILISAGYGVFKAVRANLKKTK